MKEFDFASAHAELCVPAYLGLSVEIRQLVELVDREARELQQERPSLLMPWPDGLRERFEAHVSDHLAEASHIVHAYGHWGTRKCWQEHGTYWKFSNYADQVLAARLQMPGDSYLFERERWHSLNVMHGMLRLGQNTEAWWRWVELGYAVSDTLDQVKKRMQSPHFLTPPPKIRHNRDAEPSEEAWAIGQQIAAELKPSGLAGRIATAGEDYLRERR